jgi:hypothetical protein
LELLWSLDLGAWSFFRPCSVVQSTRLPLMQEITGAKPVRDAIQTSFIHQLNSQSSQRSGGFHKSALSGAAPETATISPPCSSLRASFVKKLGRGSTGWRPHQLSIITPTLQQSITPFFRRSRSPIVETRRRERRQCRCNPGREHHLAE